jgi:2-polyprenyl-3-methyl-5-hydroxy-6-metoxy-1,4-benzoquinol methylase
VTAGVREGAKCPFCTGTATTLRYVHDGYRIIHCRECDGGFAMPRPTVARLDQIYDPAYVAKYTASVMHSRALARWRYELITRLLRIGETAPAPATPRRILDVGCGGGALLQEFKNAGWEVNGTDVSPEFAHMAQALGIPVVVGDATSIDLPVRHFDLITMSHVVEHFVDPLEVLAHCARWLRGGGAVALETPNWKGIGALVRGSKWSHIIPPEHLNYFTPKSLRRLALRAGLARPETATTTPPFLEGLATMPWPLRRVARLFYRLAALGGIGTTLLCFAFNEGDSAPRARRER